MSVVPLAFGLAPIRAHAFDSCPADIHDRPVLSITSSSAPCTSLLQASLNEYAGRPRLVVNGKFDKRTAALVRNFQRDNDVFGDVPGEVGVSTWTELEAVLAPVPHPFSVAYPDALVIGASHTLALKKWLGLSKRFAHLGIDIPNTSIDAIWGTTTTVGPRSALDRLRQREAAGRVPDLIMVLTGVNDLWGLPKAIRKIKDPVAFDEARQALYRGYITEFMAETDHVSQTLGRPIPVLWFTLDFRSPTKDHIAALFNAALADEQAARRDSEAGSPLAATLTIVDWAQFAAGDSSIYGPDGIHLTMPGYRMRRECTVDALRNHYLEFGNSTTITCLLT